MCQSPVAAVALLLSLAAAPAAAVTAPLAGGAPLPPGLALSWPFAAGEAVTLLSGYGPNGGSSLHAGLDRLSATNDYYALDLVLEDEPDHGRGQPVLAPAAGTVVLAGWATAGFANYGQRVLLQLDYGDDGHVYIMMFCHLERIDVVAGQHLEKGEPLGALGSSCQGALSCGSFDTPHLHLALHQDSTIGGSGAGGSYGGHAVVPELVDDAADLEPGDVWVSMNGAAGPPPPAPACAFDVGAGEVVVEETGPCARRLGTAQYWHDEDGHGGASLWTFATDAAAPDNNVIWHVDVAAAARVEVLAHVPPYATSAQASYAVTGADGAALVALVDQSAVAGGVVSLGTLQAAAGRLEVRLLDNTGEPYTGDATSKKLAFDALTFRPAVDAPPVDPPPGDPPPGDPPPGGPPPTDPPGDPHPGGPPSEPPHVDAPAGDTAARAGCTAGGAGLPFGAALALLARRRRRPR